VLFECVCLAVLCVVYVSALCVLWYACGLWGCVAFVCDLFGVCGELGMFVCVVCKFLL